MDEPGRPAVPKKTGNGAGASMNRWAAVTTQWGTALARRAHHAPHHQEIDMLSPGQTSFKSFQKMERFTQGIKDQQMDCIQRGHAGEDTSGEFIDLVKRKSMAYQGMSA